jgi:hypothetical protein
LAICNDKYHPVSPSKTKNRKKIPCPSTNASAATVRGVLATRNAHDEHGVTSSLSLQEINDLCACPLSL